MSKLTPPPPTPAEVIRGLLEALRKLVVIARDNRDWGSMVVAENAIASWEARARLRDDAYAVESVSDVMTNWGLSIEANERITAEILDALEPLLLGHPGTAKERT